MNISGNIKRWSELAPYFHSILRIVAAFMFFLSGTMKLAAFPAGMPPDGATAAFMSQIWIGGVLEVIGGAMIMLGIYTRPAAFILSGEMAVAYFQFHFPANFWPTINGGMSAILYCFLWLYYSASGSGKWSIDEMIKSRRK